VPTEHAKLHVLSVAPALAEAIRRIHNGESVSSLFDQLRGSTSYRVRPVTGRLPS
jgi:hypothetical protein